MNDPSDIEEVSTVKETSVLVEVEVSTSVLDELSPLIEPSTLGLTSVELSGQIDVSPDGVSGV